ncbi:MAG: hypothetical protein ATN35_09875 [Epulopiscium sp. Nele67-Bin004]|nr:MAG: hypothetical protein ATN35_09875 [Epulopiscium sp. Nele67-Bin004]
MSIAFVAIIFKRIIVYLLAITINRRDFPSLLVLKFPFNLNFMYNKGLIKDGDSKLKKIRAIINRPLT